MAFRLKKNEELEHFFVSYDEERGRFPVTGRFGPEHATRLVEAGERRFRKKGSG